MPILDNAKSIIPQCSTSEWSYRHSNAYLVGGIPTPLKKIMKNISQLGLLFPIEKYIMFQTTNQLYSTIWENIGISLMA